MPNCVHARRWKAGGAPEETDIPHHVTDTRLENVRTNQNPLRPTSGNRLAALAFPRRHWELGLHFSGAGVHIMNHHLLSLKNVSLV